VCYEEIGEVRVGSGMKLESPIGDDGSVVSVDEEFDGVRS